MSLGIWSVELWFPGWGLVIVLYLKGINLMPTFLVVVIPLYEVVESATMCLLSSFHFEVISGAMLTKRIFFLLSIAKYGTAFDYGLLFEDGSRALPNNVK